jgi:predicted nicotinamide N-methyase
MSAEREPPRQVFPETPLEALGPVVRERVEVAGRNFLIDRPDASDRTLDHPAVKAEFAVDEYLPYWTDLWPAGRMLAKAVLRAPLEPGLEVLEVGCGLGLPGIAALARGLRVTFNDLDTTALGFAAANARLNGFGKFGLRQFDWRAPPHDLSADLILASDLVYELRNINPLVALVQGLLRPGGECWLTDQDRLPACTLIDALVGEGMPYTTRVMRAGAPGGRRVRGTLYTIRLAPAKVASPDHRGGLP